MTRGALYYSDCKWGASSMKRAGAWDSFYCNHQQEKLTLI